MDNVLPFLVSLCDRLHYTPTPAELEELQKSSMIEMRIFFEAPALGISDEELFDKIMVYYKFRARGEKSKFKLTDPLAEADRKLSKPSAPIRVAAPAAAPKQAVNAGIPAAMKGAETDRRTFNKEIDVMITPGTASFSVTVHNRGKQGVTVLLDFAESEGIKLTADATHRLPAPLSLEGTIEANARTAIGRVVPSSMTGAVTINYRLFTLRGPGGAATEATCTSGASAPVTRTSSNTPASTFSANTHAAPAPAATSATTTNATTPAVSQAAPVESKPKAAVAATSSNVSSTPAHQAAAPAPAQRPKAATPPQGDDDDECQTERKSLGENLDIIIDNDGNHGYLISIENSDDSEYYVILDLSNSVNLLLKAKGSPGIVTIEGQSAKFSIKAHTTMAVLDMPVNKFELEMCELRYMASIRRQ